MNNGLNGPYSSQNLQKYMQHELCADDQLKKSRCLDVLYIAICHIHQLIKSTKTQHKQSTIQ
jgi:Holliday junction resolvasome RuvABC endonuclease subunit